MNLDLNKINLVRAIICIIEDNFFHKLNYAFEFFDFSLEIFRFNLLLFIIVTIIMVFIVIFYCNAIVTYSQSSLMVIFGVNIVRIGNPVAIMSASKSPLVWSECFSDVFCSPVLYSRTDQTDFFFLKIRTECGHQTETGKSYGQNSGKDRIRTVLSA